VEITGPTERKMAINALNCGADGFMADLEDANSPTWQNMVDGQINLRDAIDGTITYTGSDDRHYELGPQLATLLVRPRGWHLPNATCSLMTSRWPARCLTSGCTSFTARRGW
jgi:malate synthase